MTLLTQVLTSYLGPLLKKHSAGDALVWEDLEASYKAGKQSLTSPGGETNLFVSKKLEDLHQSQVQAYREAAVKALREWSQQDANLAPMKESDEADAFVDRCVQAALAERPPWKVANAPLIVTMEVRKRARQVYAKYHPENEENKEEKEVEPNEEDENDNDEEDDGEEGEEGNATTSAEEGEDDEEEGGGEKMEDDTPSDKAAAPSKPKSGNKPANKRKTKKVIARKKNNAAKAAGPGARSKKGAPSNRGRRRQQGGANKSS